MSRIVSDCAVIMNHIPEILPESEISVNEFPFIGCKSSLSLIVPKSKDVSKVIYCCTVEPGAGKYMLQALNFYGSLCWHIKLAMPKPLLETFGKDFQEMEKKRKLGKCYTK